MSKFVYLFSEGNGTMKEILGGKGANLAEMTNMGMPVLEPVTYVPFRAVEAKYPSAILES